MFSLGVKINRADFIIWKEVVTNIRNNIEAADRTLKDLMHSNMTFGGKAALFLENFRQMLFVFRAVSDLSFPRHNLKGAVHFHF